MFSSKSGNIYYFKDFAASFNSSKESFGLFANTTLFIFDASSCQLESPIIGTELGSSRILCRTFKGFELQASAKPISSRIMITIFLEMSFWFLLLLFFNWHADLKAFSILSEVDKIEH